MGPRGGFFAVRAHCAQAQCQDCACVLLVPLLASLYKQGTERVINFHKAAQPVDGEATFFPDWPYFKVSTFSV